MVIITTPRSRSTTTRSMGRYGSGVGLNPFRSRVERRTDAIVVTGAFVVIVALVAWALFGG
ncbi:MAG: hypothetical protein AMXMBFR46_28690 [Acidimicrobiia bacterium]